MYNIAMLIKSVINNQNNYYYNLLQEKRSCQLV